MELRVNQRIRAKEVRLIDPDGKQLGIFPIREALKIAEEQGLDLVEVAPASTPPVCKIMNYGKYRYQMNKKQSSKHKTIEVKEIKVRPRINKHDLDFKVRSIKRFLEDGNKVKITMIFKGREIVYSSLAKGVFDRIFEEVSGGANVEQMAKLEGHHMTMILSPKS